MLFVGLFLYHRTNQIAHRKPSSGYIMGNISAPDVRRI